MKNFFLFLMLGLSILVGSTFAASLESFIGLDGQKYCKERVDEKADLCSNWFTRGRNTDDIQDKANGLATLNGESICIVNGEQISDLTKCSNTGNGLGKCYINDQEVPCEEMAAAAGSFFKAIAGFGVLIFIIGIIAFIFWIHMLVDAIKHEENNKALRIILIVFLNTLGAIIYYFAEKRPRKKKEKEAISV